MKFLKLFPILLIFFGNFSYKNLVHAEIKSPKGDMLGSEGFQDYIKKFQSKNINERLKIMVDDIVNAGNIQKDDLTILVVESLQ